ncbi:anthrax toxin lethal factor-related metalloendopeptidase [Bacillus sp. NTK034]|uniref:anthrax toxin lethal factor-related metalloendopeptidase n=1 Tax=Bacillus sp. NTK034 TaxID=2802176 RepID=UPI001FD344E1|nr:hypothetical protein [Bacillus sp. NTK034]
MQNRRFIVFLLFSVLLIFAFPRDSFAKVYWDGAELVKGQIGRVTVTKPINLWRMEGNSLKFVRILYPKDKYRVYGYVPERQQFRVGGSYYITNMKDRVLYETPSKSKLAELHKSYSEQDELVDQLIIVDNGHEQDSEVSKIKSRISKIPISLLGKLNEKGVKIKLTASPITNLPEYAYLKGQVPRGWEGTNRTWDDVPGIGGAAIVAIRIGYSEPGNGHSSSNLELHEVAHTIDSLIYNNLSSTQSFKEIWGKEKALLFGENSYYKNYPEEYFSETFAMFYLNEETKKTLKRKAPLTAVFFENLQ